MENLAVHVDADGVLGGLEQPTTEHLLPVRSGLAKKNLGELTNRALVIACRSKRTLEPGGADLQAVVVRNDGRHVESGRQVAGDFSQQAEVDALVAQRRDRRILVAAGES